MILHGAIQKQLRSTYPDSNTDQWRIGAYVALSMGGLSKVLVQRGILQSPEDLAVFFRASFPGNTLTWLMLARARKEPTTSVGSRSSSLLRSLPASISSLDLATTPAPYPSSRNIPGIRVLRSFGPPPRCQGITTWSFHLRIWRRSGRHPSRTYRANGERPSRIRRPMGAPHLLRCDHHQLPRSRHVLSTD